MRRTVRGLGARIAVVTAPENCGAARQPPAPAKLMRDGMRQAGTIRLFPVVGTRHAFHQQGAGAGRLVDAAPPQALLFQ